jgi:hypothetical protein
MAVREEAHRALEQAGTAADRASARRRAAEEAAQGAGRRRREALAALADAEVTARSLLAGDPAEP